MSLILLLSACGLLAIGMPVAFALGVSTLCAVMLGSDFPLIAMLKQTYEGVDSFPLMAVPFFILAAELMSGGSLTEVLLKFAAQFVGHRRGGLGYTNVVSLTFFSGISGSALADAAGPGSMMIRMMDKAGYDRAYAAALTAATAIVGPIIPPSIIMIIYALQDERVSVGALFVAGFIPGLLIAAGMAAVNWRVSTQRNYRGDEDVATWQDKLQTTWRALPALMLPVIILGGMRAGWFTPTEASVVAVFYALVCGKWIYRTLRWEALPDILSRSSLLTASVLIIIGMSNAFAWVLTVDGLPLTLAEWMAAQQLSAMGFLIAVNIFLLIFGIFIEPLPGVMVLVPILAPVAAKLGIDPIHFAMVVIFNLTLGMITPPVGGLLFVTSNVSKVPLAALTRELKPFLVAHAVILALLTFWPGLSTWAPHALGFQ
ncbi:TRAP transporter large permease [Ideonella sp. 4Y16]|uniref:TRAP transporter large permease protein n=1 Tax=Ideonella alba TaxID=2824118 RepID=A0A940YAX5_9BURK|nr:TRAP transporter large permease [Ideonella alba]MBQ0931821.1 TRAP transporter large permease [Ideonella alba]MBQ0941736.1 TRAP transporter large permease [Ideonella alba]